MLGAGSIFLTMQLHGNVFLFPPILVYYGMKCYFSSKAHQVSQRVVRFPFPLFAKFNPFHRKNMFWPVLSMLSAEKIGFPILNVLIFPCRKWIPWKMEERLNFMYFHVPSSWKMKLTSWIGGVGR